VGNTTGNLLNVDLGVDQRPAETFLSAFQGQILRVVGIDMTASYKGQRWEDWMDRYMVIQRAKPVGGILCRNVRCAGSYDMFDRWASVNSSTHPCSRVALQRPKKKWVMQGIRIRPCSWFLIHLENLLYQPQWTLSVDSTTILKSLYVPFFLCRDLPIPKS
jgi:hypothetical protein